MSFRDVKVHAAAAARAVTVTFRPLIAEATTALVAFAHTVRFFGWFEVWYFGYNLSLYMYRISSSVGREKYSRHPTLQLRRA